MSLQLDPGAAVYIYRRRPGWKGDVPVVRLNSNKIRKVGWVCCHMSREAMRAGLMNMIADERICYA